MTMHGGVFGYGFTAFFVPLAAELATSRGVLSIAFSFTRLESGLLGPIEGLLIDRFGPRKMMLIGYALFGLSFLLFSQVHSLLTFYVVFALLALGASLAGLLPIVTTVNNWFVRRRGLATGIALAGINVGGMLIAVMALAITSFGWRTVAVGIAIMLWVLGPPVAAMMRHRPQSYGYLPDGDMPEESNSSLPTGRSSEEIGAAQKPPARFAGESSDFTPGQALRTPAFWLLAFAHSFSLLIVGSVTIHEIPLLVDAGMTYESAAAVLSFMTAMAVVGRVGGGFVGDKLGMKPTLVVSFVLMSVGLMVLGTAQSLVPAVLFAITYGFGYGARSPLLSAIRADYFGIKNFATIMGLAQPILVIGAFLGPTVAGFAYDAQGSYRMVFAVISLVNLIGALLVLFIRKPAIPR
ncbi:MFS transporter [Chloroflexota bacterium]